MGQAQRADAETAPLSAAPEVRTPALDDTAVLGVLESDCVAEEGGPRAAIGIRNGVLLGAGLWVLALLVAAALGYL